MSEQKPIHTNTANDTDSYYQPRRTSYELLPGTELDLAAEIQRIQSWTETEACIPPAVIGTFNVDTPAIDHIVQNFPYSYVMLQGRQFYSEDDEIATYAASEEGIKLIEWESRIFLKEIYDEFAQLVQDDMARASNGNNTSLQFTSQRSSLGIYINDDELHSDNLEAFDIRYIVTLVGPSTIFYKGRLPRNLLDVAGELLVEPDSPEIAVEEVQPLACEVIRFTSHDPHKAPEVKNEQFRFVLDATLVTVPV